MAIKMVSISLKSESDSDSENFGNDLGNHIVAIRYIVWRNRIFFYHIAPYYNSISWRNRIFFATFSHIITLYIGVIAYFLPHCAIL